MSETTSLYDRIVVEFIVSRHKGERELGKYRAAGWPRLQAPEVEGIGYRQLYFRHPGDCFPISEGRIAQGLRIRIVELDQLETHVVARVVEITEMPVWLIRLALRSTNNLVRDDMAAACLDVAEDEAIECGIMPEYLKD